MTVTVKLADGSTVAGELVKSTTIKPSTKTKAFRLAEKCPLSFKGKQRQIVRDLLATEPNKFFKYDELIPLATEKGLSAVGGIGPSVLYHLHQMELAGHVVAQ